MEPENLESNTLYFVAKWVKSSAESKMKSLEAWNTLFPQIELKTYKVVRKDMFGYTHTTIMYGNVFTKTMEAFLILRGFNVQELKLRDIVAPLMDKENKPIFFQCTTILKCDE